MSPPVAQYLLLITHMELPLSVREDTLWYWGGGEERDMQETGTRHVVWWHKIHATLV